MTPVPQDVVQEVESYVEKELSDRDKYSNRMPLDESGIYSLHRLVARIYGMGFDAGERVEAERSRAMRNRLRDTTKAAHRAVWRKEGAVRITSTDNYTGYCLSDFTLSPEEARSMGHELIACADAIEEVSNGN
ncbi:hypothetical protein A5677_17025 [Mycobacterium malmoense]|uniref:Uncharacterized protein n=1 Tax=Mycobacterium malmoense TaxID=1780 RepID=A0A1B9DAA3_MYCMA|nr:hypothetical protein A5677_17025 [Mycobacterium malmoense]